MKAKLAPVFLGHADDPEFTGQVENLRKLLEEEAEILEPVKIGFSVPDADAVLFPQLIGEAFKQMENIRKMHIPVLVVTSEFGTVAMWDWEIVTFLRAGGIKTFAPYSLELTKTICRALALKREMKNTKFLVFQDNPGDGMQAGIFKRFYWWEDECSKNIRHKFGIAIEKRSFKKLGEDARKISDEEVKRAAKDWDIRMENVSGKAFGSAVKMYLAVKREISGDKSIRGVGMNCLNESFYSDTTPCLAWDRLFEEEGLLWACEADTLSLLTEYITYNSLRAPLMMSNMYPFLVGMAALKHEKINEFPSVREPDNCILVVHCGYMGMLPCSFCTEWALKPKVLEIVDGNAVMIDARMAEGDVTLAKLHPSLEKLLVIGGRIEEYVQYPGSDCRNGALVRVKDGHKVMDKLYSHHDILMQGDRAVQLELVSKVLEIEAERI